MMGVYGYEYRGWKINLWRQRHDGLLVFEAWTTSLRKRDSFSERDGSIEVNGNLGTEGGYFIVTSVGFTGKSVLAADLRAAIFTDIHRAVYNAFARLQTQERAS